MRKKLIKNREAKVKAISVFIMIVLVSLTAMFVFNPFMSVTADYQDFDMYKDITIDHTQVADTLANFPICINLTDTSLRDNVLNENGYDIAFFDETGATQYNHEIEYWDGATGRLVAWVNITSLSGSTDTVIRMSYGNNDAVNYQDVENTWDEHYMLVHHFNGSSAIALDDSTNKNNDVTGDAGDPTYMTESVLGYGVDLDGAGDYLTVADDDTLSFGNAVADEPYSVMIYCKPDDVTNCHLAGKGASDHREWFLTIADTDKYRWGVYDDTSSGKIIQEHTSTSADDMWYNFYATYTGSETATGIVLYVNGDTVSMTATDSGYTACHNQANDLHIGEIFGWGEANALIDEMRCSDIVRNASWVETVYNNIVNATDGGFYTLGEATSTSVQGSYSLDGLDANTRFTHSALAGETNTSLLVMKIFTNTSATTDNCTAIYLDYSGGYPAGFSASNFSFQVRNTTDGTFADDWNTVTGNMTLNSTTWSGAWAYGTDPFPITNFNSTIEVRMKVVVPDGTSAGVYTTDSWKVVWQVVTPS